MYNRTHEVNIFMPLLSRLGSVECLLLIQDKNIQRKIVFTYVGLKIENVDLENKTNDGWYPVHVLIRGMLGVMFTVVVLFSIGIKSIVLQGGKSASTQVLNKRKCRM